MRMMSAIHFVEKRVQYHQGPNKAKKVKRSVVEVKQVLVTTLVYSY